MDVQRATGKKICFGWPRAMHHTSLLNVAVVLLFRARSIWQSFAGLDCEPSIVRHRGKVVVDPLTGPVTVDKYPAVLYVSVVVSLLALVPGEHLTLRVVGHRRGPARGVRDGERQVRAVIRHGAERVVGRTAGLLLDGQEVDVVRVVGVVGFTSERVDALRDHPVSVVGRKAGLGGGGTAAVDQSCRDAGAGRGVRGIRGDVVGIGLVGVVVPDAAFQRFLDA